MTRMTRMTRMTLPRTNARRTARVGPQGEEEIAPRSGTPLSVVLPASLNSSRLQCAEIRRNVCSLVAEWRYVVASPSHRRRRSCSPVTHKPLS